MPVTVLESPSGDRVTNASPILAFAPCMEDTLVVSQLDSVCRGHWNRLSP